MIKRKRGQFFIIFAVILGILILSLATVFNTAIRTGKEGVTEKKFNTMCENYKEEIYKISQHAINTSNKSGEADLIEDFTRDFMTYAEKTDPDFKLVYVYGDINEIIEFNSTNINNEIKIIPGPIEHYNIQISKNIIKHYELTSDEKFWFVALTEKEGEEYVCE